jgi:hypothetical protein
MAKIRLGALAGSVSGSIGTYCFSRNRYGPYVRIRTMPIQPTTFYTNQVHSLMTALSQLWASVPAADKVAWKTWAAINPITDVLGDKQIVQPNAAFIGLNFRSFAAGGAGMFTPPVTTAPAALTSLTPEYDIGAGDYELNWTPDPLPANCALWILSAIVQRPGINYVTNLRKWLGASAAAQACPFDVEAQTIARFGTLAAGLYVHHSVAVVDVTTGLLSRPLTAVGQIVST